MKSPASDIRAVVVPRTTSGKNIFDRDFNGFSPQAIPVVIFIIIINGFVGDTICVYTTHYIYIYSYISAVKGTQWVPPIAFLVAISV